MRGLLPSVWLLGAALYTSSILALVKPFAGAEVWPAPRPVNETVMAKQPLLAAAKHDAEGEGLIKLAALTPAAEPRGERRDEWVQVAGYTTMVRSRPSSAAPALFAYSVGRPLRVLAHEGGFVRVQDLGSGKLGWVEEASLAPFVGGYRQREDVVAEPQIAAVNGPQAIVAANAPQAIVPPVKPKASTAAHDAVVAAKQVQRPGNIAIAARPKKETVAAVEPAVRGLFRRKRGEVQRVALGGQSTGLAAMVDRAFRGF